jgi:hypothetical protein
LNLITAFLRIYVVPMNLGQITANIVWLIVGGTGCKAKCCSLMLKEPYTNLATCNAAQNNTTIHHTYLILILIIYKSRFILLGQRAMLQFTIAYMESSLGYPFLIPFPSPLISVVGRGGELVVWLVVGRVSGGVGGAMGHTALINIHLL